MPAKPGEFAVPQLHSLEPERHERLKGLVEGNRGRLVVLVHPFFHMSALRRRLDYSPSLKDKWEGRILDYMRRLPRLARAPRLPVAVVFEESHVIRRTHERLQRDFPQKHWVFVPTRREQATPAAEDWRGVAERLHALGARHLLLAGELYDPQLGGCVGAAHAELKNFLYFKTVRVLPGLVLGPKHPLRTPRR
jgi:hypothetical protein